MVVDMVATIFQLAGKHIYLYVMLRKPILSSFLQSDINCWKAETVICSETG